MVPSNNDVMKYFLKDITTNSRKLKVLIKGGVVLIVGIIMIVAPGPAFIVIPLGLLILSKEFLWAKRLLNKMKRSYVSVRVWWRRTRTKRKLNAIFQRAEETPKKPASNLHTGPGTTVETSKHPKVSTGKR